MIPYGRQDVSENDIKAVVEVLRSDFLTQGPVVPAFEEKVKERCGCRHAMAVHSATSALHLACLALGIGPGDEVWTSPITFVATANAALYCGAGVGFVDIDPRTYNMCPVRLRERLARASRDGRLPKAVIPVHLTGQPCDMAQIRAAAEHYDVRVIEDASHAIGASYRGDPTGSCRYSDITVFSFHPVKIVTTGEGGMALTNDDALAERMRLDRSHGITRDPAQMRELPHGPWYYEQVRLGFNYRMTDMAAALGLSQLGRLGAFLERRREIAAAYDAAFAEMPVKTPWQQQDACSAWHLYVIRIDRRRAAGKRDAVFEALRAAGIGVNLHYIPVYRQPWYRAFDFSESDYPQAEQYYAEAISLPMFPGLSDQDQRRVIGSVERAVAS